MAKPKHGRYNNYASSATNDLPLPSSSSSSPNLPLAHLPRHRSSLPSPSPSPAVLAAIAIIATTTPVVTGGPLPIQTAPPSFLCPFIERDIADPTPILTTSSRIQAVSTPAYTSTSTAQHSKRRPVADKYVRGSDSLWRKTDAWTLYGSTCCSSSTSTAAAQSEPSTSSPTPSSSSTTMPTTTPTAADFDTSTLPAGWDHTSPGSTTESTIILALAIVLAGSICVFMLGCVIWRKRKKKSPDTERKVSHKHHDDGVSDDDDREKDARGKMQVWAKASARWKSHIRHSARRRRKKAIPSKGANLSQFPNPEDSPEDLSGVSTAVSRRSSFVSQEPGASRPETSSCISNTTTLPGAPPRSPSPPIYGAPVVPRLSGQHPSVTDDSNAMMLHRSSEDCSSPSAEEEEPLPYLPPSDGHVATDDKVQLARIHELASSPRNMPADPSASTLVSAPEWHDVDDDLGGLVVDLSGMPASTQTLGHPPLFPPPPVEVDIPQGYLSGGLFHCREEETLQVSVPIAEPLAPSFEISPSAPPIGDLDLEPSAPFLEDEDDMYGDWDGASSYLPAIPTRETVPAQPEVSFPRLPSTRGSVATDIALPRYQP